MAQALTNVLLMDAVMGCLQDHRPIAAASKLAYFDKIIHEGLLFSLNAHVLILFIFITAIQLYKKQKFLFRTLNVLSPNPFTLYQHP